MLFYRKRHRRKARAQRKTRRHHRRHNPPFQATPATTRRHHRRRRHKTRARRIRHSITRAVRHVRSRVHHRRGRRRHSSGRLLSIKGVFNEHTLMIAGGVVAGSAIIAPWVINRFAAHLPGLLSQAKDASGNAIAVPRTDANGAPVNNSAGQPIMDNVFVPNPTIAIAYTAAIPIAASVVIRKFAPRQSELATGLMIGGLASGMIFALQKFAPKLTSPAITQASFVTAKELSAASAALLPSPAPGQTLPVPVIQASGQFIRGVGANRRVSATGAWQKSENAFANTGF